MIATHALDLDDADLMQRIAEGHVDALEAIYDRYANLIYSFAMRMVGEPEMARDVVRHAFARLWARRLSFDPARDTLDAWLLAQTHQIGIADLRFRRAIPQRAAGSISADPTDEEARAASPDLDTGSPWSDLMAQRRQQVRGALEALPKEQRHMLELAYFQGYTREDIARLTGEPVTTISDQLRAGLLHLRDMAQRTVAPAGR